MVMEDKEYLLFAQALIQVLALIYLFTKTKTVRTYQLEITNQVRPAFEGANEEYEWSYQGSFKKVDAKGQVTHSGKLYCNIYK